MAKKKTSAETESPQSTSDFVDRIYDKFENEFGAGTIMAGSDYVSQHVMRIPFSPSLDSILHGGIDEGSFVGITGLQKTGKTTTALSFCATAQRPEYGSRPVFYGKAEGRLSRAHTKDIEGLNTAKPHFNVIQSVEGKILSAEDHLRIYEEILKSVPGCVLLIDSISSLVEKKVLDEGVGTQTRGSGAKLFSQWLDLVKDVVVVNRSIVIGVTHIIANTSGMGSPFSEKVTNNWKYMYNYHLATKGVTPLEGKGGKPIGLQVNWKCSTTSNGGSPFGTTTSIIRFGVGVDRVAELIQFAVDVSLIKKSGAWFELSFLSEPQKAQGTEGVYRLLKSNPEYIQQLEIAIGSFLAPAEDEE